MFPPLWFFNQSNSAKSDLVAKSLNSDSAATPSSASDINEFDAIKMRGLVIQELIETEMAYFADLHLTNGIKTVQLIIL